MPDDRGPVQKSAHTHTTVFFGKHKGADLADAIFMFAARLMHMVSSRKTAVELTRIYYEHQKGPKYTSGVNDIVRTYNKFREEVLDGVPTNQEWNLP